MPWHGQPEALPFPHVPEVLARFQAAGGRNFIFTHRSCSVHDFLAKAGLTAAHAADSQGLIHLRRKYCDRKDCLRCRFGKEYLRRKPTA